MASGSNGSSSGNKEFQFMVFESPTDFKKYRKQVKSHVTTRQHAQARKRRAERSFAGELPVIEPSHRPQAAILTGQETYKHGEIWTPRGVGIHYPTEVIPDNIPFETTLGHGSLLGHSAHELSSVDPLLFSDDGAPLVRTRSLPGRGIPIAWLMNAVQEDDSGAANQKASGKTSNDIQFQADDPRDLIYSAMLRSVLSRSFSRGAAAFQTFLLHDSSNTVGISLHHLGVNLSSALGYYEFMVKVQAQDFEPDIPPPAGVPKRKPNYISFLDFIFTDPMLVTVALLLTAEILVANRLARVDRTQAQYHLLQLRGFLIRTINAALEDPTRAISNQMLVAVCIFAAYELRAGALLEYRMHMDGVVKLVALRGGMANIGQGDPGAERFLLWHAVNTGELAGYHDAYRQLCATSALVTMPKPDPKMFRMQHVDWK